VSLTGRCLVDGALGVYVYGPIDDDEAARLMYPNGLKLSMLVELPVATAVSRLRWSALRGLQRLTNERAWQIESLK